MGLTLQDILSMPIGLTLGILNERSNMGEKDKEEEVIQGNADMLKHL